MKNRKNIMKLLILIAPVFMASAVMGNDITVSRADTKRQAIVTSEDNNSDNAFATDLKTVEDLLRAASLLRNISHQRGMTSKQSNMYVSREMKKVIRFNNFSMKMRSHSFELIAKMRNPDGLLADGRNMVKKSSTSWEGYDFISSGYLMKGDLEKAIKNYRLAMQYAPDLQKDWYKYMIAGCLRKENPKEALKLYDEVIAKNENWVAIKNSYITASLLFVGKDNDKAVDYFDKGTTLFYPGEKTALVKSGVCDKFKNFEKKPKICSK